MARVNEVKLNGKSGVNTVAFTSDNNHCITSGVAFEGVGVDNSGFNTTVKVSADRKGSKDCVPSFNQFIESNPVHLIQADGGPRLPVDLNFWIMGTLTLNGQDFRVILAMGTGNNWFLGSTSISGSNAIGPFKLRTSGTHTFEFSTN
jgi:hypothetical protein